MHGRRRGRAAPHHASAAVRPRPRPLLLPALVDGRLDPRRHRARLARARERVAAGARRARRAGRADRRHPHASRPRRRCARRRRSSPARRCCRAARTTTSACSAWGRARPASGLPPTGAAHGVPASRRRGDRRASPTRLARLRCTGSGDPSCSTPETRSTAGRSRCCRGHADGHIVLHPRRRDDRRRHDPRADHPGDRPLPEFAARSARRLPRDARRGSRSSRRGSPTPGTRPERSTTRPRAHARSRAPSRERLDVTEAALERAGRVRPTTSRSRCFGPTSSATLRRFADAESLAHLERLVHEGRAARVGPARYSQPLTA